MSLLAYVMDASIRTMAIINIPKSSKFKAILILMAVWLMCYKGVCIHMSQGATLDTRDCFASIA